MRGQAGSPPMILYKLVSDLNVGLELGQPSNKLNSTHLTTDQLQKKGLDHQVLLSSILSQPGFECCLMLSLAPLFTQHARHSKYVHAQKIYAR